MKSIAPTNRISNPARSPAAARTTAALIATIAAALEGDGSYVEPGSIDSQGLSVVADQFRWRIELDEPELLDAGHYCGPACYDDAGRSRCNGRDTQDVDRDWMADTGRDLPF